MADVLTAAQRHLNMSRIRGKDTKPELQLRRALHANGLRYRLHDRKLPGRPDLVFPRFNAVIQVHGCFWHGHACPMFKMPATRQDFWSRKISGNRTRDAQTQAALINAGWRVLTVWECSLRGPAKLPADIVAATCQRFLAEGGSSSTISGSWHYWSDQIAPDYCTL